MKTQGIVQATDAVMAPSGTFSTSLTVSGEPVATGTGLTGDYVAKSGDNMTGDLWIDGADLTISGTTSGIDFLMGDIAVSGMITIGENHNYPAGEGRLIYVPPTAVQKGQGYNSNVFAGFWNEGIMQIDSAQGLSQAATFADNGILQETGAITSAHGIFQKTGFASSPSYRLAHNETSTAAVPILAGYVATPSVRRESGYTGNATITQMGGFVTNPLNPYLVFLGAQQIKAGFTVNKYAHFEANSDVGNQGLEVSAGTLEEEVGLDLQNINTGDTCISIRSTATGAPMQHAGPATIGENRAPQSGFALDVQGDTTVKGDLVVSGTGSEGNISATGEMIIGATSDVPFVTGGIPYTPKLHIHDHNTWYDFVITRYDGAVAPHALIARAKGTASNPDDVVNGSLLHSWQLWGYGDGEFRKAAVLNGYVDDTVSGDDVPGMFQFKTHQKGTNASYVQAAFEIHSDFSTVNYGRRSYAAGGVANVVLSTDVDDYNPNLDAVWRVTANTTDRSIIGIAAPVSPTASAFPELTILNVGSYNVILANQSASSSAANRIITGSGIDWYVAPDCSAHLLYDNSTDRWRIIGHHP